MLHQLASPRSPAGLLLRRKMRRGTAAVIDYATTWPFATFAAANAGALPGPFAGLSRTGAALRMGSKGVLEYGPHNLLLQSGDFSNAAWNRNAGLGVTGALVVPSATNTYQYLQQNVSRTAGARYTRSVRAKSAGYNHLRIQVRDLAGAFISVTFNVDTGAAASVTSGVIAYGAETADSQGRRRFWMTYDAGTGANSANDSFLVGPDVNGTANGFAGNGTSGIELAEPQENLGDLQTYVPTTSAAVYRPRIAYSERFTGELGTELVASSTNESAAYALPLQSFQNVTLTRAASPTGDGFAGQLASSTSSSAPHQHNTGAFLEANKAYRISGRVYVPTGGIAAFKVFDNGDGSWFSTSITTKDAWVSFSYTRPAKSAPWSLAIGNNNNDAITSGATAFWVDDLSVKEMLEYTVTVPHNLLMAFLTGWSTNVSPTSGGAGATINGNATARFTASGASSGYYRDYLFAAGDKFTIVTLINKVSGGSSVSVGTGSGGLTPAVFDCDAGTFSSGPADKSATAVPGGWLIRLRYTAPSSIYIAAQVFGAAAGVYDAAVQMHYGWESLAFVQTTSALTSRPDLATTTYGLPHNLLLQSNNFASGSWSKNGGTVTEVTGAGRNGASAWRVTGLSQSDADVGLQQNASMSGQYVSEGLWVKGEGSDIGKVVTLAAKRSGGSFAGQYVSVVLTADWQLLRAGYQQLSGNTATSFIFSFAPQASGTAASSALICDAQMNLGQTLFDVPTTSAAVWRPDLVTTVSPQCLGLQVEGQATNLCLQSTTPSGNVGLTSSGVTSSIVGSGTENGIPYVDVRFVGTPTVSGTNFMDGNIFTTGTTRSTVSASTQYTFSWHCRAISGAGTTLSVVAGFVAEAAGNAYLNLSPTTPKQQSADSITKNRESVTWTTPATTVQARIALAISGLVSGTPIDCVFRFGGGQLEAGAVATSLIPTTGTTAVRAADGNWELSGADFTAAWNQAQGTMYVEIVDFGAATATGMEIAMAHLAGNISESIGLYAGSDGKVVFWARAGGTNQAILPTANAMTKNGRNKLAFSWGPAGFAAVVNGATVVTGTGTVPAPSALRIAGTTLISGAPYQHILSSAYTLRNQLTGAALQAITA